MLMIEPFYSQFCGALVHRRAVRMRTSNKVACMCVTAAPQSASTELPIHFLALSMDLCLEDVANTHVTVPNMPRGHGPVHSSARPFVRSSIHFVLIHSESLIPLPPALYVHSSTSSSLFIRFLPALTDVTCTMYQG
jgi:hypothetical protein